MLKEAFFALVLCFGREIMSKIDANGTKNVHGTKNICKENKKCAKRILDNLEV